ncbi:MAG: BatD family protein [Balneolales bacterium]
MKKTGNRPFNKFWGMLVLFLLACGAIQAQNQVSVKASVSEDEIFYGEQTSLTIEITSSGSVNIDRPSVPTIDGMRYLSDYPSTSTRYSNVNGEASMSYSYTWQLISTREGVHQIPSIPVTLGGETYDTEPLSITVLNPDKRATALEIESRPDVFLELEVSDRNPVRGQQLIAELVIYFKSEMDLSSFQVGQGWVTEGFWQEDLNEYHSARAETKLLDGVRFRRAVLRRHSLFPTRAGKLKLQPYEIQASVRYNTRSGNNHDFFSSFRSSTRNMSLESNELTINVRDLPEAPNGVFINAVGSLDIKRTLNNNEIKLGESVDIITEISGSGNIALVSRPHYEIPAAFDVYQPQETTELDKRSGKVSGKKIFRDVIIARKVGRYEIPATQVARYNDERRRYETVTLPALAVEVIRDPNAQIGYSGDGRFNVTPITGMVRWSSGERGPLYKSWWLWVGLILPLLVAAGAYRIKLHQNKMDQDVLFSRKQTAANKASYQLNAARKALNSHDAKAPYSYIHQALAGFITDRTGMTPSGHSDVQLAQFVRNKSGNDTIAKQALSHLAKCSTIRFAPIGKPDDVLNDIRLVEKHIESLSKYL